MDTWKQAITKGNLSFQAKDYEQAIQQYQNASIIAKQQLMTWFNSEEAINAIVISELNLAEAFCRLQHFEQAIETYSLLSTYLRSFQDTLDAQSPLLAHAAKALTRVKNEFLQLTQTYAQDIIQRSHTLSSRDVQNQYFQLTH